MLTVAAAIEAILFASGEPVERDHLAELVGIEEPALSEALIELSEGLVGRGVSVIQTGAEVELRTAPEASALVRAFHESELARDLGKASLETLAVVAYQAGQGASRGEIDWVRGVNSSASLRTLLLRGLVEGSEDPRDKRRIRYSLTTEALAHLGLTRIEDLPRYAELAQGARAAIAEASTTTA